MSGCNKTRSVILALSVTGMCSRILSKQRKQSQDQQTSRKDKARPRNDTLRNAPSAAMINLPQQLFFWHIPGYRKSDERSGQENEDCPDSKVHEIKEGHAKQGERKRHS